MTVMMLGEPDTQPGGEWRPEPAPWPAPQAGRRRILLVEDDGFVRGYVARLLTETGYDVVTATDGAEALLVALGASDFDLVITDIRMPVMDGRELGARLRAERPELPLIYLSGYDTAVETLPLPPGRGQVGFLAKPFEAAALLGRVYALLGPP